MSLTSFVTWSAGHIVFLGAFFLVLLVVAATVTMSLFRAWRRNRTANIDSLRWQEEFHDLPTSEKHCRHEFTGEFRERVCANSFDCRACQTHGKLAAPGIRAHAADEDQYGLSIPVGRLYHRGHTWVRPEGDGVYTIGLDDLGARMIGTPDSMRLPVIGARLTANGPGWWATRSGIDVRVLSPIDGEVTAVGSASDDWILKVRNDRADLRHLLEPREAGPWLLREMERLQLAMTGDGMAPALADGGVPCEDLPKACPNANWTAVWGRMFLET